jgi:hypothetical protein
MKRLILPQPINLCATQDYNVEQEALASLGPDTVLAMGTDPELHPMPKAPTLLDFMNLRFTPFMTQHLLQSAERALKSDAGEHIVMACLLHDISLGALLRPDHGYWSAQLIEPYVSEEIAWAVRYHQVLRYFPDDNLGYSYPREYQRYFGEDYQPPAYIEQEHQLARQHRWYLSARLITLNDAYSFRTDVNVTAEKFTDIIGRHFRQPAEGLGFDHSPSAHMWRSMIWPGNFL